MVKTDLEKLFQLKKEKYRIRKTQITFDKEKTPNLSATVTLRRNGEIKTISSSEEEFVSHVIHLHSIPHIEDDDTDFVYIDNPNEFFDIEKKVVDMFGEEWKEFIICERNIAEKHRNFTKRIKDYEREWILSEKVHRIHPTRLCRIFYDVLVLMIRDSSEKCELIEKDKIRLSDIQRLLGKSRECDVAVCCSAFLLTPKPHQDNGERYDAIIGLITYDLKNRRTLSLNLNTISQFQRRIQKVGHHGFWECIVELHERTYDKDSFKSFLPLPLNIRDFTPLPWFCYVFLNGVSQNIVLNDFVFDLPLFLIFGTPLILRKRPSYIFTPEKQTAFIMLGFREKDETSFHQLRFDVSKGEPQLHLDYEIYFDKKPSKKILNHFPVDYRDIWKFNENLAIGFLAASAYDVKFDTVIVPERISGIKDAFGKNPLTVYPLFVRSRAGKPYRLLKERPKTLNALRRVARRKEIREEMVSELENMGLMHEGKLTILGDIVLARLQQ